MEQQQQLQQQQQQAIEQFVPQGPCSLSSDAPGWSKTSNDSKNVNNKTKTTTTKTKTKTDNNTTAMDNNNNNTKGPTCWKCRGDGFIIDKQATKQHQKQQQQQLYQKQQKQQQQQQHQTKKRKNNNNNNTEPIKKPCTVCFSKGHLPPRKKLLDGLQQPPIITRSRKVYDGWINFGPKPLGVLQNKQQLAKLQSSTTSDDEEEEDVKKRKEAIICALTSLTNASSSSSSSSITPKDVILPLVVVPPPNLNDYPKWTPTSPGEQLCNLIGYWRILQCVGSHRWTTDDFMTAYIASQTFQNLLKEKRKKEEEEEEMVRYLDLGTGNGSVLQMVTWYLLHLQQQQQQQQLLFLGKNRKERIEAVGIEARLEAVNLARRSLSFNIGDSHHAENTMEEEEEKKKMLKQEEMGNVSAKIIRTDFRDLVKQVEKASKKSANNIDAQQQQQQQHEQTNLCDVAKVKYDLVTGTPPYFRVDFKTSMEDNKKKTKKKKDAKQQDDNNNNNDDNNNNKIVTSAIINQGGMPTSIQSAPARCEFRGGIEAYCVAAASVLKEQDDGGRFIVCENWLNDDRVHYGANEAKLEILSVYPVKGKVGRKENLFAVYVMAKKKKKKKQREEEEAEEKKKSVVNAEASMASEDVVVAAAPSERNIVYQPAIAVRDENGKWTDEYAAILESMSIPARHETSKGII